MALSPMERGCGDPRNRDARRRREALPSADGTNQDTRHERDGGMGRAPNTWFTCGSDAPRGSQKRACPSGATGCWGPGSHAGSADPARARLRGRRSRQAARADRWRPSQDGAQLAQRDVDGGDELHHASDEQRRDRAHGAGAPDAPAAKERSPWELPGWVNGSGVMLTIGVGYGILRASARWTRYAISPLEYKCHDFACSAVSASSS